MLVIRDVGDDHQKLATAVKAQCRVPFLQKHLVANLIFTITLVSNVVALSAIKQWLKQHWPAFDDVTFTHIILLLCQVETELNELLDSAFGGAHTGRAGTLVKRPARELRNALMAIFAEDSKANRSAAFITEIAELVTQLWGASRVPVFNVRRVTRAYWAGIGR